jgi:large subunit ribosomal protein L25
MPEIVVAAESRTEAGKNVNRRLRASGRVPGVLYGANKQPQPLSVEPKAIGTILRSGHGENTLFDLEIGGTRRKVILKEYQIDPIKGKLLHADFFEVALDRMLTVPVHIELTGTSIGVKLGGQLDFVTRTVEVECLPTDIPEKLLVDISALEVGHYVRVSELKVPAKVKVLADPEQVIVHVVAPRAEEAPAAETAEAAAPAAGAEPAVAPKGKEAAAAGDKKPAEKKAEKK